MTLLALSIALGLVVVAVLGGIGDGASGTTVAVHAHAAGRRAAGSVAGRGLSEMPEQDPQDRIGTAAHRRAAAELASHRALQHLPFRSGDVSMEMVGARGPKAVIRIEAGTVPAARRAWQLFLERFRDGGEAYLPVFKGAGGRG
ncbi:MAG: hypothetical protein JSU06_02355 [Actinobacteria bacterium]|nr:hypothetical protein [Actinomycetota bacterium]